MNPEQLLELLESVRSGARPVDAAAAELQRDAGLQRDNRAGYTDLGEIKLDVDRTARRGFPEVVYCASKSAEQITAALRGLLAHDGIAVGTRCAPDVASGLLAEFPIADYNPVSRVVRLGPARERFTELGVAVLAAGTSDRPVAEEACSVLEAFGAPVDRVYDVGVAGLHRLLDHRERIKRAGVLVVVAGMEGALPSVVGGLFPQPIIAVPTSVGYGSALGGFTALFGMLSSCAGGLTVVNIDNGFGAAMAALSILRLVSANRPA